MVAFVNSVQWQVDNAEHALITMPSQNVVAGNNLVAYLRFGGGVSTPTLSDTAGNTYTRVDVVQLGTTDSYIAAYYCLNCLGNASNVAEFEFPVGRLFNRAWINQYSSTNPMAFVSYDPVTDTGTSITSAGLAASDNGILVAGAGAYSGTVSIAGDLTDIRTSGLSYVGEGDVIFSGSGTKTAAFTASPSTDLGMIAMLFSDAASGGTSSITVSQTETGDSQSATIASIASVTVSQTETGDSQSATIASIASVTVSQTETGDSQSATIASIASVTVSQTEAGDSQSATIASIASVTVSQTEAGDSQSALLVTVLTSTVAANQTETEETQAASLYNVISITGAQTEAGDSQALAVRLIQRIAANQTEAEDTQTVVIVIGQLAASQVARYGSNSVLLRTGSNSVRIL